MSGHNGGGSSPTFLVTLFRNLSAQSLTTKVMDLDGLRHLATNTAADTKDRLPLLKLARFGDRRSEGNSLRHDENVEDTSGVELDYDREIMSFAEAVRIAKQARVKMLIYTSPSHTSDKPRWRIVAPFSRSWPPEARAVMAARINGIFGGIFATESFTLSQAFYYGRVNSNANYQDATIEGDFIDLRDELDEGAISGGSAEGEGNADEGRGEGAGAAAEGSAELPPMLVSLLHIPDAGKGKPHGGYPSRSELAFAFITGALRARVGDVAIASACLDSAYSGRAIFEHCKGNRGKPYVKEQIKHAKIALFDKEVTDINKTHALVLAGNKAAIMKLEGKTRFRLLQISAFQKWFANQRIAVNGKMVSVADYWLSHRQRRQYEGIEFAPAGGQPGYYNLWRGFSVEPRAGDCSLFLNHIRDNVAQGDTFLYNWVTGWFAQIVQHPTEKVGTALCLRGKQGTGKTKVGEVIGSLFADHYELVADPRYITGQFNAHLAQLLLLHADEAFWAGDKRAEGKLKDLITGLRHRLEFKGVDPIIVQNLIRLFVTGNQDWLVPAGFGERRFAVIDVGDAHKEDHPYFAAIDKQMDNGGREALLYHLLNFDLSTVDLRTIPKTEALLEQIIDTATPEQAWWLDTLKRGRLPRGMTEANMCPKRILFLRYIKHANLQGVRRRAIETKIGMFLNKYVGADLKADERKSYTVYNRHGQGFTETGWVYTFPPLAKCREHFAQEIQQTIKWGKDATATAQDEWTLETREEAIEGDDLPF